MRQEIIKCDFRNAVITDRYIEISERQDGAVFASTPIISYPGHFLRHAMRGEVSRSNRPVG